MAIDTERSFIQTETRQKRSFVFLFAILGGTIALLCFFFLVLIHLNQPAKDAPQSVTYEVPVGASVRDITEGLAAARVVQSPELLYFVLTLLHNPKDIKASVYVFEQPLTTKDVARKLVTGDFGNDLISFIHYEGERATHIAIAANTALAGFDTVRFLERAIPLEGRLYPETYKIPKNFTADELVDLMEKTYREETADIQQRMQNHILTEQGILTLASIIEREANTPESMKMVSGILQNRLAIDMPLQADASVEYILDKPLKELTPDDLRVDSPYNTYLNRGLPPTPIGNPGIVAIMAVLEPTPSEYFYYITDETGTFHYAKTYDEHKVNIERYLR